jgi:hypothetical protein
VSALRSESSGDAEEIATRLAAGTIAAASVAGAGDTGAGAASISGGGIGAASVGGDDFGWATATGAGAIPLSSDIAASGARGCGGCAELRVEAATDPLAGTASKKKPDPNDPMMITATNPTTARCSSVPTGSPTAAAARRPRAASACGLRAVCGTIARSRFPALESAGESEGG